MKSVITVICFLTTLVGCRSKSHIPGRFATSTSDYLYIDNTPYLMSYSPLQEFKEYKSIYYTLPNAKYMQFLYKGTIGFERKSYAAIWSVQHDSLYLSGILYAANDPFSLVEIPLPYYRVMERFLNKTLYAKPVRDAEKQEFISWVNEPFLKLTFKHGKLLHQESINVTPKLTKEAQKRGFERFEDSITKIIKRNQQPRVRDSIDSVLRLPAPIYILP